MALELRQQMKLKQQLVMTPQLQQAIKLLQLSRVELLETVQQQLLENPFLEVAANEEQQQEAEPEDRKENFKDEVYDRQLAKEEAWEDYLGEFASTPKTEQQEKEEAEEYDSLESRYSTRPSLEGHLLWQLHLSDMTEEQKKIGEVIIGNLSSSGYLQSSLEEIADMAEASLEETRSVLERIQLMDPVGVAARDVSECLMIQIKHLNYDRDPVLVELVQSHLEDLEARRYKQILRKFKLDMEDLQEYLDVIKSLEPMPGSSFGSEGQNYISPDIYVERRENDFVIYLNEDDLPHLTLSPMANMDMSKATEKEKEYFLDKSREASWLIKSLDQRQRTLYNVTRCIVEHQRDFFENGVTHLQPLILKDIANDISVHESTISRITTNKYVSTPHGTFELKYFFNSGLVLEDGSQVGSESVKALIKKFIAEEDPGNPLSDEAIGDKLKEMLKVTIARRTVAKYRTALNIPSSSKRKKIF